MTTFRSNSPWNESGKEGDSDNRFNPQGFAEQVGMDWTARKVALVPQHKAQSAIDYAWGQDPSDSGDCPQIESNISHFGIERSDTGDCLGIVKGRYECLQPLQSIEWFTPWLKNESLALHSAGVLEGGAKTWVMAEVLDGDQFTQVVPGDEVARFMLLFNSFDGSSGVLPMFSPIRMFCTNQLPMVRRTAEKLMSIRHSSIMHENLEFAQKVMAMAKEDFDYVVDQYRILANAKTVNAGSLRTYVRRVLGIGINKDGSLERFDELKTRSQNIIQRVEGLMDDRQQTSNPHSRGSWYSAFNAVNGYINHHQGNNEGTRLKNLWFGQNLKRNENALKLALEMAA
jgi:phage/plasmid-like protein (TIGR03299 family)